MKNEEAPLCVCGKPRKRSKNYVQVTGSMYYKTCGDRACMHKNQVRKTVGKKFVKKAVRFNNNPDLICQRGGCFNKVGGSISGNKPARRYCSKTCYLASVRENGSFNFGKLDNPKRENKRKFLSEVYSDFKSGATKMEIRRKYRLDWNSVDLVIDQAVWNRKRELREILAKTDPL